ncbi:tail assembly protein [Plesiomonas shigelloides]|uniref:tail assembly protein n=1 Tax=Plesiomonas shigelloides TaxID=703 RepID=UPI001C5A7A1D|nr:tail assembly protein [Plesiomonas shigelloides]MBW3794395.1 tail assembly protein [Plesiomonas shigelloides]
MAIVRLYGDLQRFGRRFDLSVTTAAEAVQCLTWQISHLRTHIQNGRYRLRINRNDIGEQDLVSSMTSPLPADAVIHIVPVVSGAKNGWFQTILGTALLAVSFFTPFSFISVGVYAAMGTIGASMALGGVASLLTKTPTLQSRSTDNGKENTYFSNLDNTIAQGSFVPLLYGEMMTGSKVLSQGLSTE